MATITEETGARDDKGVARYGWTFENADFDEGRWELRVAGELVELERKPLDLLQYLLRHAGEAVTKDELLDQVWEGRVVVEAVLTNAVTKLRKALGDTGACIATLPKVGYRLDAKVTRRLVEHVPEASRLVVGDTVPRRGNWKLEEALARSGDGGEVWRARHAKTGQARVFKFSLDGRRLAGLKREVTVGRLLEQALGARADLVKVIDWDFEQAPYFVEFEDGGTGLDRWHGFENLPLEQRLALFAEAADAVVAAHGVGVLHKDLKPANLLVYETADGPHLRVADFGSSRVFEPGLLENLGITRLGFTQTVAISPETGTPLYLAPEVLTGQSPTTKSDIYALGVTLYQMIVGDFRRPLAAGWENDIPDPQLRADIASAANGDPARRPESAAALAEGIRTLEERRQKAALEAAIKDRIAVAERRAALARARRPWIAAAMLVLVAGTGISLFYAQRSHTDAHKALAAEADAKAQTKKAEQATDSATSLNNFLLQNIVGAASEFRGGSKDLTVDQALRNAETKIHASFAKQPELEVKLRTMFAAAYRSRMEFALAVDQYNKIIPITDVHPNDRDLRILGYRARMADAGALLNLGKLAESDKAIAPVLKAADAGKITEPATALAVYFFSGQRALMAGDYTREIELMRKARATVGKLAPSVPSETIASTKLQIDESLGEAFGLAKRYKEALSLLASVRQKAAATYGESHPETLNVRSLLVEVEVGAGHFADAQHELDTLRPDVLRVLGPTHQLLNDVDGYQASLWAAQGMYAKALPLYATVYPQRQKALGVGNPLVIQYGMEYADIERLDGDVAQASKLLDGIESSIKTLPADTRPPLIAQASLEHGCLLVDQGHSNQARALARTIDAAVTKKVDDRMGKRLDGLMQSEANQKAACSTAII